MADGAHRIETGPLNDLNLLNPYLQGAYEPVAKETTALDLKVIGEIPKDLWGCFYRNGPNPAQAPEGLHHWFDGDGMVHAIHFENGKAEYRKVELGRRIGDEYEILSGVNRDETVVIAGQTRLKNGSKVNIVKK